MLGDDLLKLLRFLTQTALLWFIYWLGTQIANYFHLILPGNVVGLLLLFLFLSTGVIKPSHIEVGAELLLKHMVFFFIPICAGVMNWGGLFAKHALILTLALFFSAVIALAVTGWTVQLMPKSRQGLQKNFKNTPKEMAETE